MTPLPTIDISTPEAAAKSLRAFDKWRAEADADLTASAVGQAERARLAIDNMRFPAAHESEAMKAMSREEIEKLRELLTQQSSGM